MEYQCREAKRKRHSSKDLLRLQNIFVEIPQNRAEKFACTDFAD
jgi:hypothetical protein